MPTPSPQKSVDQTEAILDFFVGISLKTPETDFLRARAFTTQLQGDDWLDCECTAAYLQSKIKADIKLIMKALMNLTRTSSFSHKASMTFPNHCRLSCVKKLCILVKKKKKKKKKKKQKRTYNKAIIKRN